MDWMNVLERMNEAAIRVRQAALVLADLDSVKSELYAKDSGLLHEYHQMRATAEVLAERILAHRTELVSKAENLTIHLKPKG